MAELFRTHGLRLGASIWLLVAVWAIGLVAAPGAALVGRSVTAVTTTPIELRREIDHLRHDIAAARGEWDRTVDPERRAEIDRRIRMLTDRVHRLDDHGGAPRRTASLAAWVGLAGPPAEALRFGLAIALTVTAATFLVAYPVAWLVARPSRRRDVAPFLVVLAAPWALDPVLRLHGWQALLSPVAAPDATATVVVALIHAHLPAMLVPLLVALRDLDPRQIEAARDLGAAPLRIHRRIVLPHAAPGLAVGIAATFTLSAAPLVAPMLLAPDRGDGWFAPTLWRTLLDGGATDVAAAGAMGLLVVCLAAAWGTLRLFGVRAGDLLGREHRHDRA